MIRHTVVVVAAVLALAGCQGEPEVKTAEPTPSPVVSSSAVVSETAAPETAEVFIRRWSDTSVAMQNTGDTAAYRAITGTCTPCAEFAAQVESYYAAGGYIRIAGQQVTSIEQVPASAGTFVYDVGIDPAPTKYLDKAGGDPKKLRGDASVLRVTLSHPATEWTLDGFTQLAQ